jgi:hypothetical protein
VFFDILYELGGGKINVGVGGETVQKKDEKIDNFYQNQKRQ